MRKAILAITLLQSQPATASVAEERLQSRLDRILVGAGYSPKDTTVKISDDRDLRLDPTNRTVSVPRTLVLLAPSWDALDGLMSMMVSWQAFDRSSGSKKKEPTIASALAFASLMAASGGVTDGESESIKTIPINDTRQGHSFRSAKIEPGGRSLRGARWQAIVGSCSNAQISFLRYAASEQHGYFEGSSITWPGSAFARQAVASLGMLGHFQPDSCVSAGGNDLLQMKRAAKATESE
jgi:hypothetical protein